MPASALHGIAAVAVVIAYSFGVWMQVMMLLQRRVDLLAPLCISLLPFVLTVYLLQGRPFARPLLIAFSIYSSPLGLGLMTGLGTRAWQADVRAVVETVARLVVLTTLTVAALLAYWRRRNRSNSGLTGMESAT